MLVATICPCVSIFTLAAAVAAIIFTAALPFEHIFASSMIDQSMEDALSIEWMNIYIRRQCQNCKGGGTKNDGMSRFKGSRGRHKGSLYVVRNASSPAASVRWLGGVPRTKWYFDSGKKISASNENIHRGWTYVA